MDLILERIRSGGPDSRVEAAAEIRWLTRTSSENRRALSGAIEPLVSLLRADSGPECNEAAILALLNLAVKDERNKMKIVESGALESLLPFLESFNPTLQEYATAALLTLSASATTIKQTISASGAVPLLVKSLSDGTPQAKADAVAALYNLSALPPNLASIASSRAVPPLLAHLRTCKKSSRTAEKCIALLESLVGFEDGRDSLISADGGVLAVVEVIEEGSPFGRERAVGALLAMCETDRDKYRESILREGAIPGLLELTVRGTPKARCKARELLRLLRNAPCRPREEVLAEADALESVIGNIVSKIDGDDRMGKAKKMVAEMVQLSMEQSLRHLQQRAHW